MDISTESYFMKKNIFIPENEELFKTWGNSVGCESRKTWFDKLESGFFQKYMMGQGLDIGGRGYLKGVLPILPTAEIIDLDYPNYDGKTLPFYDNTQDYIYSSHCLEHIDYPVTIIRDWFRVVKPGGYIIIVVPHRDLYEKKQSLPSRWNADHKTFYTPASLLEQIERSLQPNTYRIRHLQDNDRGHKYDQPVTEHSVGEYEIEAIIQKL